LLARLVTVGQAGVRVRCLGGNRAGEVRIGRFLRNRRVTPKEMMATARAHTAGLVKGRHVLAIQSLPPRRRGTRPACAMTATSAACICTR
jgi:hypothetical protein